MSAIYSIDFQAKSKSLLLKKPVSTVKIYILRKAKNRVIFSPLSQKTKASREKLNTYKANNSAPICAFFVPRIYAPLKMAFLPSSMVVRNGQRLIVDCFPCMADSHPVTHYRQTVRSFAVVLENLIQGTTQMNQFIFAAIIRTDLSNKIHKIRINAQSETHARALLARDFVLLFAGVIRTQATSLKTFEKTTALLAQGGAQ